MSKQTLVALTEFDEKEFLEFLRSTGEIKIFFPFAPDPHSFEVSSFLPVEEGYWQFLIWPTAFPWQPRVYQIPDDAPAIERRGWYYIFGEGPIIEYSRHNFDEKSGFGRVYWGRGFLPNQLPYDERAFSSWYSKVVRWLRTRGARKTDEPYSTYYLPDAWARYGST